MLIHYKVIDVNDFYELKQNDIMLGLSKVDNKLVIANDKVNYDMRSTQEVLPDYIKNSTNKIFIVAYTPYSDKKVIRLNAFEEAVEDIFYWTLKVTGIATAEEKQQYILHFLQKNKIKVGANSKFVDILSREDMIDIDRQLMYVAVKSKANKASTITDAFLTKIHREQYLQKANKKSALDELDDLIGLEDIKKQIKQIVNYITTAKCRHQPIMIHTALLGNSGCGKNEIARVIGKIYKEQGVLSKGDFIEVSRSDLVAGYVGQSALKTRDILEHSKGSILYIDECYSLDGTASEKDYSHEVVSEIIKFMEDNRDNICIIFGGYIEETERFLESNRGFNSRVPFKLYFNDYTAEELYQIFQKIAKENRYKLSTNIKPLLIDHFEKARLNKEFGNGRYVRNILDKVAIVQSQRITEDGTADIDLIKKCDIIEVLEQMEHQHQPKKKQIGFSV